MPADSVSSWPAVLCAAQRWISKASAALYTPGSARDSSRCGLFSRNEHSLQGLSANSVTGFSFNYCHTWVWLRVKVPETLKEMGVRKGMESWPSPQPFPSSRHSSGCAVFSDPKEAVSQKPCLVFPSCFNLLWISFHHRLCLLYLTNMTHLLGKNKSIQWRVIHIWLSKLLESFTSPYLICMCFTWIFLAAVKPIACVFSLGKTLYSPSPLPLQQFYTWEKKSSSLSLVCVQLYCPVAVLCTGVLEPPGTLAWPTKISCAEPQKALGHFSELSEHQLSRMVLFGGSI